VKIVFVGVQIFCAGLLVLPLFCDVSAALKALSIADISAFWAIASFLERAICQEDYFC
jgi:hypothetical protein